MPASAGRATAPLRKWLVVAAATFGMMAEVDPVGRTTGTRFLIGSATAPTS
jgi:hypothetical protein